MLVSKLSCADTEAPMNMPRVHPCLHLLLLGLAHAPHFSQAWLLSQRTLLTEAAEVSSGPGAIWMSVMIRVLLEKPVSFALKDTCSWYCSLCPACYVHTLLVEGDIVLI